jgi:hypothetical protein
MDDPAPPSTNIVLAKATVRRLRKDDVVQIYRDCSLAISGKAKKSGASGTRRHQTTFRRL